MLLTYLWNFPRYLTIALQCTVWLALVFFGTSFPPSAPSLTALTHHPSSLCCIWVLERSLSLTRTLFYQICMLLTPSLLACIWSNIISPEKLSLNALISYSCHFMFISYFVFLHYAYHSLKNNAQLSLYLFPSCLSHEHMRLSLSHSV